MFNPLPAGGASQSAEFPVLNPTPSLTSISTTSVVAGGNAFLLTVTGADFQPTSMVTLNGTAITTTYVNAIQLQTMITADEIAIPGTLSVGVTTPSINGLGGGASNTLPLTVTPVNLPPPVISQIAPGSATAGGPGFPLLITGVGFASNSIVTFGSVQVPVTNFSATTGTTLTVSIPASAIVAPGTEPVVVNTAAGISAPVTFYINNPPPTTGGVNPPVVPAGSAALTLNVTGANFVSGSTVLVNGASRVTTFVSSTLLQATLLASDISHGGTLTITVSTPGPGGGLSGAITLAVADYAVSAVSSTASVSPGQVAQYTLTIAPSNGAYANPVTFTASGLPAGGFCILLFADGHSRRQSDNRDAFDFNHGAVNSAAWPGSAMACARRSAGLCGGISVGSLGIECRCVENSHAKANSAILAGNIAGDGGELGCLRRRPRRFLAAKWLHRDTCRHIFGGRGGNFGNRCAFHDAHLDRKLDGAIQSALCGYRRRRNSRRPA